MRICILNSRHSVNDTRVKRITETLAEVGYELITIAPRINDEDTAGYDEKLGIKFIELARQPRGDFRTGRSLKGILKTILSRIVVSYFLFKEGMLTKADVFHCNEVDSWVIGILLAIITRSKVVFDVHEYYPARITDVITGRVIGPIAEKLSRFLFQFFALFSDGLIFVNQSLGNLYRFHGKKTILRNCVRKSDFQQLTASQERRIKFQDRVLVLHIGSLREQYGPRALLDSLAYIEDPQVLLLIVGGAGEGFLPEVEKRGYAEQVQVIEHLPFEELLDYLALADMGISPLQPRDKNTIYSLARKFLEYVAAGIPVIISDFPEYRFLVEKFQLGLLIDPQDPQEIAAAVNRLVEDKSLRERLGQNAIRAFEVELNWEMESRKLLELYNGLKVEG